MEVLSKNIDIHPTKYNNLLFWGDFNVGLEDASDKSMINTPKYDK